ncbi:MAG: phospholipase D-like domain-containing protein [Planctomycetaceae bacterium]
MPAVRKLGMQWNRELAVLVSSVRANLCISSPYVTDYGVDFLLSHLANVVKDSVQLTLLTDLSPLNVAQGATSLPAIHELAKSVPRLRITHLPRVHAKVFVQDSESAIVTSGNLTAGGLITNYEYGMLISDRNLAGEIESDMHEYTALGADVSHSAFEQYCTKGVRLQSLYSSWQNQLQIASPELQQAICEATDDLIRLRLSGGAMHTVFAATIVFLLTKYGPLSTDELHCRIADMHPDLCDNTVDRVIDGKRFGKKWKHAVRSAQQHLKRQQKILLLNGVWQSK